MLIGRDITLEIGGRTLLEDATVLVGAEDKVALVGRNGTGKSSLLSYLLGESPTHLHGAGRVQILGTVGFLPQVPVPEGLGIDPSAFSHVLSARGLDALDDELQMARRHLETTPTEEAVVAFSDLEERYRLAGGYEVEAEIGRLADGLGLPQEFLLADTASLSGGQRRRVDLIRVLFSAPDILILDEPTNHLDRAAKVWLMEELATFPGALLLVSHDLRLLDHAISKVLTIAERHLLEFKGNYSASRAQLTAEIHRREKVSSLEGAQIAKMRAKADKWRHSTETQARKAKVLDRKVERLEAQRTTVMKRERRVRFRLPEPARAGAVVLDVNALAISYGEKAVLHRVGFVVDRGDRVVVVGRNGAGKSSLLRCLSGVQAPNAGTVSLGHAVALGYFAQEHEQIDLELGALDNIDDTVLVQEAERRALLGSFGLTGTTSTQRAGSLSGGERARLSLAMLAAGRANLLVLDEPTNNLDPASVEAVGAMLSTWKGTIVAVSHDRPFVEALQPTHALHLPEERYGFWREEYLEQVEVR
ncbi:MAG TPA: ABC-F family ATP-binding cassette domain-containing protein [Acidimicrobiales bacterium]|nr:ABC-F family ATP-binding cassette domain-containing protein [Acidimicrobiales bacterium]